MTRFDLDLFGLRIRFKVKDPENPYIFVEKVDGPRRDRWYLTIPLAPMRAGADAGHIRPHLSRETKKGKEHLAFDAETFEPFPVDGIDWPGAFKFALANAGSAMEWLAPMHAELKELNQRPRFSIGLGSVEA